MSRQLNCQCIVSYKFSFSRGLQTENIPEASSSFPVHFSFNHWFPPTGPPFQQAGTAGSCDRLGWDSLVSVTNTTDANSMKKKKTKSSLCCYNQARFRFIFFLKAFHMVITSPQGRRPRGCRPKMQRQILLWTTISEVLPLNQLLFIWTEVVWRLAGGNAPSPASTQSWVSPSYRCHFESMTAYDFLF